MNELISKIRFEIEEIDEIFKIYGELIDKVGSSVPNEIELAAFATVIHSFYNGVENTLLSISKAYEKVDLDNKNWHKNLLKQMVIKTDDRIPVISEGLKDVLAEFLAFRHFFRHSYSFRLEWEELEPLAKKLNEAKNTFKKEMLDFVSYLTEKK